MFCAVIMPIYNEAKHLDKVLYSFTQQTQPCDLLILVDDGSTDNSHDIQRRWAKQQTWIEALYLGRSSSHAPGQKVVHAFYRGYEYLQQLAKKRSIKIDLIGKFDGDVVLPHDYFATLRQAFTSNDRLGLASGLLYIQKNQDWVYEQIAKKQKVRGPIKLYRQECFEQIQGLSPCLGWDSIDQWLAQYWGWEVQTFPALKVHHLKATAQAYSQEQLGNQGLAFAHMGYGFWLSLISLLKLGMHYKNPRMVLSGLFNYWQNRKALMITQKQAKFIRKSLWRSMLNYR